MKKLFEGSGVALVTPFKDGKVNYEKLGVPIFHNLLFHL